MQLAKKNSRGRPCVMWEEWMGAFGGDWIFYLTEVVFSTHTTPQYFLVGQV